MWRKPVLRIEKSIEYRTKNREEDFPSSLFLFYSLFHLIIVYRCFNSLFNKLSQSCKMERFATRSEGLEVLGWWPAEGHDSDENTKTESSGIALWVQYRHRLSNDSATAKAISMAKSSKKQTKICII